MTAVFRELQECGLPITSDVYSHIMSLYTSLTGALRGQEEAHQRCVNVFNELKSTRDEVIELKKKLQDSTQMNRELIGLIPIYEA